MTSVKASQTAYCGFATDSTPAGPDTEFYDAMVPPLRGGSYLLSVEQRVDGDGFGEIYTHEQPIQVTGPRFGLAPGCVFALHPPAGGTADYSHVLASITLTDPALPWTLDPGTGHPAAQRPPWLALLLLTSDEVTLPPAQTPGLTGTHPVPLAEYLTPPADLIGPAFTATQRQRFLQENPSDCTVTVVDVEAEIFGAIAPGFDDLALLAHARTMDADDVAETDGGRGSVAVVLGSRVVGAGVYAAHLVSVEGFTGYLKPGTLPHGRALRLLSLASWSFTSVPGGLDFPAAMNGLDSGLLRLPETFQTPRDEGERHVSRALEIGYTGADYRTRLGERSVAWYRGPCLPLRMKRNPQPFYRSADAALIYDQHTGMFDTSFAVAWQTGRLVALGDRELMVELLSWAQALQHEAHFTLERAALRRTFGEPAARDVSAVRSPDRQSPSRLANAVVAGTLALLPPGAEGGGLLQSTVRGTGSSAAASGGGSAKEAKEPAFRPQVADPDRVQRVRRRPEALKALLSDPAAVADLLADIPFPDSVARRLGRLRLLYGLPFDVLVPDARMLPPESVRFFCVDDNWLAALLDGALDVVAWPGPHRELLRLARTHIFQAAVAASAGERARRLAAAGVSGPRRTTSGTVPAPASVSGFLLRSSAVADWPGLRVHGFADAKSTVPLSLLRLDRPAPTVLLALFQGMLGSAELATPVQDPGFAVRPDRTDGRPRVALRGLGGQFPAGCELPGHPSVPVPLRSGPADLTTVDITALRTGIAAALDHHYDGPAPVLRAGGLALHLIDTSRNQVFAETSAAGSED